MGKKLSEVSWQHENGSYITKRIPNEQKWEVFCPTCAKDKDIFREGKFIIGIKAFKSGQWCPCSNRSYRYTKEQYKVQIDRVCTEKGFTFIDYEIRPKQKMDYIKLHCSRHDRQFTVRRDRLLTGAGCIMCRGDNISNNKDTKTTEEMITTCKEVHGDKFDYSKATYNTKKLPITVICPTHGEFHITYHDHLKSKTGCQQCSKFGYKLNEPANLYLLVDNAVGKCKVGITNNDVQTRLKQINNSSNKDFKEYKVFHFKSGKEAIDLETKVLNSGIPFGDIETYNGSTEVTDLRYLEQCIAIIEEFIDGS